MNKKKSVTTLIVAMSMVCMMSMSALADIAVVVSLPSNQVWTSGNLISRDYDSAVSACCESVYPANGSIDLYTKIQARLVSATGIRITKKEYVVLEEGTGYHSLSIIDAYKVLDTVYIQFRGNTNAAATAVVDYFAL